MRVNEDIAYLLDFDTCINVCELLDVGTWKKMWLQKYKCAKDTKFIWRNH